MKQDKLMETISEMRTTRMEKEESRSKMEMTLQSAKKASPSHKRLQSTDQVRPKEVKALQLDNLLSKVDELKSGSSTRELMNSLQVPQTRNTQMFASSEKLMASDVSVVLTTDEDKIIKSASSANDDKDHLNVNKLESGSESVDLSNQSKNYEYRESSSDEPSGPSEVFTQVIVKDPNVKFEACLKNSYLSAPNYVNKFLLSKEIYDQRLKEPVACHDDKSKSTAGNKHSSKVKDSLAASRASRLSARKK